MQLENWRSKTTQNGLDWTVGNRHLKRETTAFAVVGSNVTHVGAVVNAYDSSRCEMVVNAKIGKRKSRVITYIDGFNLYFGLKAKDWRRYMWLDLWEFSQALLLNNQVLQHAKYFTSRVRGNVGKQERQSAYLDALTTLQNVSIYWGRYQPDEKQCQKCGHYAYHPQEKKTDVNIATQLLCDAFHDRFDMALIVSGDADLVPPIDAVKELFPQKRIVAAFPPERYSSELASRAHAFMNIHENSFRRCLLPEHIDLPNGLHVDCPSKWK